MREPRRYAASLRVSSRDQQRAGTIATQRAELRAWFEARDIDPVADVHWFEDEAVSGSVPIAERAGGGELAAAIRSGAITKAVVTYAIDRINRDDIVSYFVLEGLCEEYGLALLSITEGVDTGTEWGQLLGGIRAVLARDNIRKLRRAMEDGRRRLFREGRWVTKVPFPFERDAEDRLVANPAKAAAVRRAYEMLVHEGARNLDVLRYWAALGYYAPSSNASITDVLRNRALVGEAGFGRGENRVIVPCERVLSDEEFAALQLALDHNAAIRAKRGISKSLFFLSRVACAHCGEPLNAKFRPPKKEGGAISRYYYHYSMRPRREMSPLCTAYVGAVALEDVVWGEVVAAVEDTARWEALLLERLHAERPDARRGLAAVEARLAEIDEREGRLVGLYLREKIAERHYDAEMKVIASERAAARREADALRARAEGEEAARLRAADLRATIEAARDRVSAATTAERRLLCDRLISRVVVDGAGKGRRVIIEWAV